MGQLPLPFPEGEDDLFIRDDEKVPTPAEAAILREFELEEQLRNLRTPEDRQRHFARRAAEERTRARESRKSVH